MSFLGIKELLLALEDKFSKLSMEPATDGTSLSGVRVTFKNAGYTPPRSRRGKHEDGSDGEGIVRPTHTSRRGARSVSKARVQSLPVSPPTARVHVRNFQRTPGVVCPRCHSAFHR